jgi:lipoprotein-releasing system permease protein
MLLSRFEFFIANRYLRAKRKQAAISVITVISIAGVAAGVMALVVALAVTNGFRTSLQESLLSATAHINIRERESGPGIRDWQRLIPSLKTINHVRSADPSLYGPLLLAGPGPSMGAEIKGIDLESSGGLSDSIVHLEQGHLADLNSGDGRNILLGTKLAEKLGMKLNDNLTVIVHQGDVTPFGVHPRDYRFRVVGIFATGVFEIDNNWAYLSLKTAQQIFSIDDVINTIEIKLDDPERAAEVASAVQKQLPPELIATTWMDDNRQLRNAFKMDRWVALLTVGLILIVSGLNIFITLTMMVMEKNRDIAVLMSMGARREQIRNIFLFEGLLIGGVGTIIGLIVAYTLCAIASYFHWPRLDEELYLLSYVRFQPLWSDGVRIAAFSLLVSLIATLWPARAATRIAPVEALRYE